MLESQSRVIPDFLLRFGSVVADISSLLEIRLIEGNHYSRTHLGQSIKEVLQHHNRGDQTARDLTLLKLAFLAKHLREIKAYDADMFRIFRRALRKCKRPDDYFGLRMEINTAASLARKGVSFAKREAPDFAVETALGQLFIECGSGHFDKDSGNVTSKLGSVVHQKASFPYATPSTALFLDMTNILFTELDDSAPPSSDQLKDHLRACLPDRTYGTVLIFSYVADLDAQQYQSNYIRTDAPWIAPELTEFLERHYPINPFQVNRYVWPRQG